MICVYVYPLLISIIDLYSRISFVILKNFYIIFVKKQPLYIGFDSLGARVTTVYEIMKVSIRILMLLRRFIVLTKLSIPTDKH